MKYIVTRTSLDYSVKPCDEAKLEKVACQIVRTASKEEMEQNCTDEDFDGYENFITKDGEIWCKKKEYREYYVVSFDSLEQLDEFVKKYESVIVSYSWFEIPTLEIYDAYRE